MNVQRFSDSKCSRVNVRMKPANMRLHLMPLRSTGEAQAITHILG